MSNYYQYDRSLITVDIPGAQSKIKNQYMNRLLPSQIQYAEQEKLMQITGLRSLNKLNHPEQSKFGRRRYQHDFHHLCTSVVPQGEHFFPSSQKKHYQVDEGEIKQYRALENQYDMAKQIQADRILSTNDIEGAVPGTLISKVVRNKDIAQKVREQREQIRITNNRENYLKQMQNYTPPHKNMNYDYDLREKSYSVQQSPQKNEYEYQQQYQGNSQPYDYMNKGNESSKLPRIQRNQNFYYNPVQNKFQVHEQRNIIQNDYEKTLKILNQRPTPLRLHL